MPLPPSPSSDPLFSPPLRFPCPLLPFPSPLPSASLAPAPLLLPSPPLPPLRSLSNLNPTSLFLCRCSASRVKLLRVEPSERMTLAEAMEHPWLKHAPPVTLPAPPAAPAPMVAGAAAEIAAAPQGSKK